MSNDYEGSPNAWFANGQPITSGQFSTPEDHGTGPDPADYVDSLSAEEVQFACELIDTYDKQCAARIRLWLALIALTWSEVSAWTAMRNAGALTGVRPTPPAGPEELPTALERNCATSQALEQRRILDGLSAVEKAFRYTSAAAPEAPLDPPLLDQQQTEPTGEETDPDVHEDVHGHIEGWSICSQQKVLKSMELVFAKVRPENCAERQFVEPDTLTLTLQGVRSRPIVTADSVDIRYSSHTSL